MVNLCGEFSRNFASTMAKIKNAIVNYLLIQVACRISKVLLASLGILLLLCFRAAGEQKILRSLRGMTRVPENKELRTDPEKQYTLTVEDKCDSR
jgi:hypothetical protein